MRKDFTDFNDLLNCISEDKSVSEAKTSSMAGAANRYPVRFVLFDNFQDSYLFISEIQDRGCKFKSINDWLDNDYSDSIITYSELAEHIVKYAYEIPDDCIITPFSELARFYNNENGAKEFDALVKRIRGIENQSKALLNNRRIYIPVVGLEGKMSLFENDLQSTIWYLRNSDKTLSYNLILTNNTDYGVKDQSAFNVVRNVHEWLDVWKERPVVKQVILCTSAAIFANKGYAQPDNAFNFPQCNNAYEFLVNGLQLNFGEVVYKDADERFWCRLASEIKDVRSFTFERFFNAFFHIDALSDYIVFLKIWFGCKDEFEKWLLTTYYNEKFCAEGYICKAMRKMSGYSDSEFFSAIALSIFEQEDTTDKDIYERCMCLDFAYKQNVKLTQEIEDILCKQLEKAAQKVGYYKAVRYLSPMTLSEKLLAIQWYADGHILREDCSDFFPDLYNYTERSICAEQPWINSYIDFYKKAKLTNRYIPEIETLLNEKNANALSFNAWYQEIPTTKTVLEGRSDIEVYYWIDGLGVDWIPYIKKRIEQHDNLKIYLNEIYVARALYPTTTENNRTSLSELAKGNLQKCGDLDLHAHQSTVKFPFYIVEEFGIVNRAIDKILSEYQGKKIAIVSDHGLTALSQLCQGLNMVGVESNHYGRVAVRNEKSTVQGNDYIICDDNKTLCALRHQSLCGKVPEGKGAHGGCTPEEVLVPVIIVSGQKNANTYSANLIDDKIMATSPVVRYRIKGLSSIDIPFVVYNGAEYGLNRKGDNEYESERLNLVDAATEVTLVIGDYRQSDTLVVNTGADEDDLFEGF